MKQIIFTMLLISAFCCAAFGQADQALCPKFELDLPEGVFRVESPITFSVKTDETAKKYNLGYQWMVSSGKIIKGQGTSEIEFTADLADSGKSITVTLKVAGLPKNCVDTVSGKTGMAAQTIYDEDLNIVGKTSLNEYNSRLDNFFSRLMNDPNAEGLLIIKFDKRDSRKYKISRLKVIDKHLKHRRQDKTRFSFIISEADSEETIFYLVPAGASYPVIENSILIKAEELIQKINQLFPKK